AFFDWRVLVTDVIGTLLFCFPSVVENRKSPKSAFPPWGKQQKCEKQCFGHGRNNKNAKNSVSAMAETAKMQKTVFRPWEKQQKCEKQHFRHGRNNKNAKNCVSAMGQEPFGEFFHLCSYVFMSKKRIVSLYRRFCIVIHL
ncbi:hypothetical protein, partial [Prevotella illustrans]|uniref:hypothetical protein n=1 Tax=Prevotella illustrans TaxID=2800387 RepID=UPI001A9D9EB7